MLNFDPNSAPTKGAGIFGLPYEEKNSALVLVPVPWEATTSYGGGTAQGPTAIRAASGQIDLFDAEVHRPYEPGIFMRAQSPIVRAWNRTAKSAAQKVIKAGGRIEGRKDLEKALKITNELGAKVNDWVYREVKSLLDAGKIAGIVGGDHSVPYGAFRAAAEKHGDFGLLHFDAHLDMRLAYEGFTWSHASIMYNAMENIPQIIRITSVGIRDFCEQENEYARALGERAKIFNDGDLGRFRFAGEPWTKTAGRIVDSLPQQVWITFDIDGLDPKLCPHTGTPVPGGLEFAEAAHLIELVARSGRKIIGFDLNEVSPGPEVKDEWDANVGMRLLYKLIAWTFLSCKLCKARK